jgi:hypothetical protein
VCALDRASGRRRWRAATAGEVWASPAVFGDTVYAGSTGGELVALDRDTGEPRWRRQMEARISATPYATERLLFVGCGDGKLAALDRLRQAFDAPRRRRHRRVARGAAGLVLVGRKTTSSTPSMRSPARSAGRSRPAWHHLVCRGRW